MRLLPNVESLKVYEKKLKTGQPFDKEELKPLIKSVSSQQLFGYDA